jgi:sugar lactone lactonase YvrE
LFVVPTNKQPFLSPHCRLGEGPAYDPRVNVLAWVDIVGEKIHWVDYSAGSAEEIWKTHKWVSTGTPVGVIGLTVTPLKYVAAAREGFVEIDLTDAHGHGEIVTPKLLQKIHDKADGMRFNDGWILPNGTFLAGSMFDFTSAPNANGKLYVYNGSKHTTDIVEKGVKIPNGIALSPDLKIMYFVDSLNYKIWKYDFNPSSGAMTNKREFVTISFPGIASPEPDGLCTSTDGSVWVAIWSSSTVRRYSSDGEILEEYKFPAARCSCPAFGGQDMDELIVTTANLDLVNPDCKFPSLSGDLGGELFRVKIPGVKGMTRYIFGKNNI